ncbi:pyridoxal phosphate-dependent transferase [Scenedesmus sp. NREL 46B-D3]|nr:pyridoxal phosphate-dependent transferase [Scenedesmus sp. NREL 46B-D3]
MSIDGTTAPQVSLRALATDTPVIVKTKQLMSQAPPGKDVLSLAQGVVHWRPPPAATAAAAALLASEAVQAGSGAGSASGGMGAVFGAGGVHSYGPALGLPPLVEALKQKLAARNGLTGYEVMVTSGANQAFVNAVLALCDASDRVVLFVPYYFNHIMALQMTGGAPQVVLGACCAGSLHPDWAWLQQQLAGPHPPKLVVLVNPCNPTGVLLPKEELEEAAAMCAAAGVWLLLDNTYEDFVYGAQRHHSVCRANVIGVFSFSKAYGMMGWRVGYIAYPGKQLLQQAGADVSLQEQLLKMQDTIAICPSQLSQHLALAALQQGGNHVRDAIAALRHNRQLVADALAPLAAMVKAG